jgi:hypothetical protein
MRPRLQCRISFKARAYGVERLKQFIRKLSTFKKQKTTTSLSLTVPDPKCFSTPICHFDLIRSYSLAWFAFFCAQVTGIASLQSFSLR